MKRIELVGQGIQHSASPGMWRRIFEATSSPFTYGLRDVDRGELPSVLADLRSGRLARVDVTMPYKTWAFDAAETHEPDAAVTGVANGLAVRDGLLVGMNTDAAAARALLADAPVPVRTALVLGAGATASSLLLATSEVAEHVYVANRTLERSAVLVERSWPGAVSALPWEDREECAHGVDLLVNTTPCGLTTPASPLRTWAPAPEALLYDLIYQPTATAMQLQAAAAGVRMVDGLTHLLAHAKVTMPWLGVTPPAEDRLRQIMAAVAGRPPLQWERLHA